MRNLSPSQVALSASGFIVLIVFLLMLAAYLLQPQEVHWSWLVIVPAFVFAMSALLLFYLLDAFVYRKIKELHKNILTLKAPKSPGNLKTKDIISALEKEVLELASRQVKEIEALKEAAQYRKEFLGNVSHELKTPIFNIQGYLHTLIDGGIDDPAVNKRYLAKASENLERLGNIVHDLEVISQIETNSLTLDFTRFNITGLIEEVFNDLDLKAQQKGIGLKFSEGTEDVFVNADRETIRQVLTNLISNSIRYGKPQGETTVSIYDELENVVVEVADNGIGIEKQHLPRLFERFYRIDKSRSRESGGTGLGLSIVKHIIEAHGQTITVRSTPGQGSVFAFTLMK